SCARTFQGSADHSHVRHGNECSRADCRARGHQWCRKSADRVEPSQHHPSDHKGELSTALGSASATGNPGAGYRAELKTRDHESTRIKRIATNKDKKRTEFIREDSCRFVICISTRTKGELTSP